MGGIGYLPVSPVQKITFQLVQNRFESVEYPPSLSDLAGREDIPRRPNQTEPMPDLAGREQKEGPPATRAVPVTAPYDKT